MASEFTTIDYAEDGHVAILTLNRPDVLNSMDEVMTGEIVAVIERLRRPGNLRALVIASTGRCFSAGGNFDEIQRRMDDAIVPPPTYQRLETNDTAIGNIHLWLECATELPGSDRQSKLLLCFPA